MAEYYDGFDSCGGGGGGGFSQPEPDSQFSQPNPTKAFPEVKISVSDIMKAGTGGKYVVKSMIFFLNPVTI